MSYQHHLRSGYGFASGILCKWRGSLYKLCWIELILLLIPYWITSIVYRHVLEDDQKRIFEQLIRYFERFLKTIPLDFIGGLYVTFVAYRWYFQHMSLPWPDKLILTIATYIPGSDDQSRLFRETLVRQSNLIAVLMFRSISDSVRRRLPDLEDVVDAGFMTKVESKHYTKAIGKTDINLYWLPGLWFVHNLQEAQRQGLVNDPHGVKLIMQEFLDFRGKCGVLWSCDWISVPLAYTQVVTLSVGSFFFACIFGRQPMDSSGFTTEAYFPWLTVLQFFFYVGALKVAEAMVDPYGDDDADFELNFLLDRHAQDIRLGTNDLFDTHPCADTEPSPTPLIPNGIHNHRP